MFSANQIAGFLNQLFFQNKSMKNIFNILKKNYAKKTKGGERAFGTLYIYFYYQDYYKKPNIKKYNV